VTEVDERLDSLFDDGVRRAAGDPRNERDPACVVLQGGVGQTSIRGLLA